MTSRPHIYRRSSPLRHPIRRIRSRSLGAVDDDRRRPVLRARRDWCSSDKEEGLFDDFQPHPLLLPPLLVVSRTEGVLAASSTPAIDTRQSPVISEKITEEDGIGSTTEQPSQDVPSSSTTTTTPVWVCLLYGMINATIVLPVLFSFGSIIYRDPAFGPHMAVLLRLTVLSGIIHQLCFSTFSSLPFCVGQVQDAGLIFLSSMASKIVELHQQSTGDSDNDAALIATSVVVLSLATAFLGCGLVAIGSLQLAQYVQLLPTCVVGGYLAYIGWFCGMSGVGLMAGSASSSTFMELLSQWQLIAPGLVGGLALYMAVTRIRHVAALPISIALEVLLFYMVLWATDTSVADATQEGWIRAAEHSPPSWQHTWDSLLRFDLVDWSVLPRLLVTEWGMIVVVALSSSLDVAAIELELQRPLDYNHELKTVGWSNIVSGLTGGYTGSYIFSQSIFTLRAGINSRVAGYALAGFQVLVIAAPVNILACVPNFFFGSLLTMICIDLMFEWLWDVRTRVLTRTEHVVCVMTFGLIQWLGVEYGIVAGIGVYIACRQMGLLVAPDESADKLQTESLDDLLLQEESAQLIRRVSSLGDNDVVGNSYQHPYGAIEEAGNFIEN